MKYQPYLPKSVLALGTLALAFATNATAASGDSSGVWQHQLLVYGWFPGIDGALNYDIPGSGGSASADASDVIDSLEFVFMGAYEGRKDKWSVKLDLLYLDLANSELNAVKIPIGGGGTAQAAADQNMTGWQLGLYGGYTTVDTDNLTVDVLAGLRYLDVEADAQLQITGPLPPTLPSPKLSQSVGLWDAIVGVKGAYKVNDKWFIPYHLDVGTGDSDLTWQALAGLGYRFDWGSVMLAYRHLYYDQGSSGLIQDLEFSGPALGVSYAF